MISHPLKRFSNLDYTTAERDNSGGADNGETLSPGAFERRVVMYGRHPLGRRVVGLCISVRGMFYLTSPTVERKFGSREAGSWGQECGQTGGMICT